MEVWRGNVCREKLDKHGEKKVDKIILDKNASLKNAALSLVRGDLGLLKINNGIDLGFDKGLEVNDNIDLKEGLDNGVEIEVDLDKTEDVNVGIDIGMEEGLDFGEGIDMDGINDGLKLEVDQSEDMGLDINGNIEKVMAMGMVKKAKSNIDVGINVEDGLGVNVGINGDMDGI